MKLKTILFIIPVLIISISTVSYGQGKDKGSSKFSAGVITGYNRGYGIEADLIFHDFADKLPFELRFGFGYAILNPGNALDARRIFINNNTNGTPEKSGRSIDYRLDFLFPRTIFGVANSFLVVGPRGSAFKGDFVYVGGNEDFEVRSHQWGVGGGVENHFKVAKNLNLVMAYGLDFYYPATLSGHDTSYSPDNDNVNTRNDNQNGDIPFTYKDADKAINQPKFMPRIMIGVNFGL
jgi:hypothetical protein